MSKRQRGDKSKTSRAAPTAAPANARASPDDNVAEEVEIDAAAYGLHAIADDSPRRGSKSSRGAAESAPAAAPAHAHARAPAPPMPAVKLLHVDEHLVVVNKPAGALSAPGRGQHHQLSDLIRAAAGWPASEPLRIVHRLDRGASGVMLYARTLDAQRALVAQFSARQVEKVYLALVTGFVIDEEGEIDLPLKFDKRLDRVVVARAGGKASLTKYRIVERVAGNTLVECRPVTGRTHQIRVHMAALGHALTVDPAYGGGTAVLLSNFKPDYHKSGRYPERPLIDRLTLHALRITFAHPATGETLTFEAELPKDFRATLHQLARIKQTQRKKRG